MRREHIEDGGYAPFIGDTNTCQNLFNEIAKACQSGALKDYVVATDKYTGAHVLSQSTDDKIRVIAEMYDGQVYALPAVAKTALNETLRCIRDLAVNPAP